MIDNKQLPIGASAVRGPSVWSDTRAPSPGGTRTRQPRVLLLVYLIVLVLIGVTAIVQAALVTVHIQTNAVSSAVTDDATAVAVFMNAHVRRDDIDPTSADLARVTDLTEQLRRLVASGPYIRAELRDRGGRVLLSDEPAARGVVIAPDDGFRAALDGRTSATVLEPGEFAAAAGPALPALPLIREMLPAMDGDSVPVVFVLWRDATTIGSSVDRVRSELVTTTIVAALLAAVALTVVFADAQRRLDSQARRIHESDRHDAATGLLNHATLVAMLDELTTARQPGGPPISVAHIDVDNFALINTTYGHDVGDRVLTRLADLAAEEIPPDGLVGRYGPDELLLVAPAAPAILEAVVERVRDRLRLIDLPVQVSEHVPVTLAGGIAAIPANASSSIELLTAAGDVLLDAKAGGGDMVLMAHRAPGDLAVSGPFDVLRGLVLAIDTKDRYTKRHSEDVARYADFIAVSLGCDEELRRTIRTAGLLHDVGKIGIPDTVLRKPGPLSTEETAIVRHHVALGDAIVRDIPNTDVVRAAIRNHHEGWDGSGYLDGLRGDEIPEIARILAIADAFSAMTTTRPYRKALSIEEALRRLGDAAGRALDPRLVTVFVDAFQSSASPPIPGEPYLGDRLWLPGARLT
jgi:diguanylate cyclase (GGDEF)-like protein/putative nucleotidyltransferase with HDIG domain